MERRTFLKSIVWAGGAAFLGLAYGFEPNLLDVSRYELRVSGLVHPLTIVALSDLHLPSHYVSPSDVVDVVNREQPDVVLVVGDTVDEVDGERYLLALSNVSATIGKFAILGNREYMRRLDISAFREECGRAGMGLLVNESVSIAGLRFLGLDDIIYGKPDCTMLGRYSSEGPADVVVCHCPAVFDDLKKVTDKPLIVISGHTHGGQIAPLGHAIVTPKGSGSYVKGWYGNEHQMMYVMRGVGTAAVPIRIGAKPEVLVLSLFG